MNKKRHNINSYYVNEKDIETESLNLQNTSPIIPDKLFYTPTISIPVLSTEKLLISPHETPITTKSTSPLRDQQKPSRNYNNLVRASTNDLHAEMIALKSFVVDEI